MPDSGPANAPECVEGPDALDAFEALTRRLVSVSVPKAEVEAAECREKARKG